MSQEVRCAVPTREELSGLDRKYAILAELRRRREAGGGVAPKHELRTLAREFPGALRELDTLTIVEIEERRRALGAALAGGDAAPWMAWMVAYHVTMRAALFVKARLARARTSDDGRAPSSGALFPDLARRIAEEATRFSGVVVDETFVEAVARPPARRVNAAVFARLGRELGVDPDVMWQELFPSRRPGRF